MDDDFQELSNSGFDTSSSATINRYGDLISRITLEIRLPPLAAPQVPVVPATNPVTYYASEDTAAHWVNAIGFACWEDVQVEIGGSLVDQLYSDFAMIYEELAGRPGVRLEESIGRVPYSAEVDLDLIEKAQKAQILYVPLPLWFSKYQPSTYGLALPIVALTFHDVRLKIKTRSIADCTCVVYKEDDVWHLTDLAPLNASTGTTLVNADLKIRLMVSSVYLDTTERTAMSTVTHSFLINTTQRQVHSIAAGQSTRQEEKLYFNHPSSSLIWIVRPLDWNTQAGRRRFSCGFKDRFDFTAYEASDDDSLIYGNAVDPIVSSSLSLNGHQRWPTDMPSTYFRTHVPYCNWRTLPSTSIYSYSFALEASAWQPTSHLNFSRLDHVSLGWSFAPGIKSSEAFSFVEAYNLLVIRDGLGGLRFSN